MGKLTLSIGWKSTLLTIVVVPLCITLGLWQLQRADQKQEIATIYAEREQMNPISLQQAETYEDKTHLLVRMEGSYTGQHWILENQWRNKVLGVEILSVFESNDNELALVNRGWIENRQRSVEPIFSTPSQPVTITASVYQPSKASYSLADIAAPTSEKIQRISYLDIEQLSHQINRTLYPWSLRLTELNPESFDTNWPQINVKPETHVGYAVQWFLFAAVALVVFVFANSNLSSILRKRDS